MKICSAIILLFLASSSLAQELIDLNTNNDSTVNALRFWTGDSPLFVLDYPANIHVGINVNDTWTSLEVILRKPLIMPDMKRLNGIRAEKEGRISSAKEQVGAGESTGGNGLTNFRLTIDRGSSTASLEDFLLSLEIIDMSDQKGNRVVEIRVTYNDGSGEKTTDPVNVTIIYIGKNQNRSVITVKSHEVNFTDGRSIPLPLPSIEINDTDNDFYKMKSGYVKLVGESIGMEKLNLTESSSNIVVDVSSNGTCISLTGNASEEDYQKLMSSATYFIMVADVATLPYPKRYVEYGIFDGVEPYSKANVTVNFVNIENPPVLLFSSSGGQSEVVERFYTAGDLFSLQDVADVLISDSDGSNMSNAEIAIDFSGNGTFDVNNMALVKKQTVDSNTNVTKITLTGSASPSTYQMVLESFNFSSQPNSPFLTATVTFTVNDGQNAGNPLLLKLHVISSNAKPRIYFGDSSLNPLCLPAPLSARQHNVTFLEEGGPVPIFPDNTQLDDYDGALATDMEIELLAATDSLNDSIAINGSLADHYNLTITLKGLFIIISANTSVTFDDMKKVLLTTTYLNRNPNPTLAPRTVTAHIADSQMVYSEDVNITISISNRNDAPSVNIGQGAGQNDMVTFTEGSLTGINIISRPHKVKVDDIDTVDSSTFNYVHSLHVTLSVSPCGHLDYNEDTCEGDYLYWMKGCGDSRLRVDYVKRETENRSGVIVVTKYVIKIVTVGNVSSLNEGRQVDEDYEKFIADIRFMNNRDEPKLFCNGSTHMKRYVTLNFTDSGSPPASTQIMSEIKIATINDHTPVAMFHMANGSNCTMGVGSSSSHSMAKREATNARKVRRNGPYLTKLQLLDGFNGKLQSGSQLVMDFSSETNTPAILKMNELARVVDLFPQRISRLPRLSFWNGTQQLVVVFPFVNETEPIPSDEIGVSFKSYSHLAEPCDVAICHADGQSSEVDGSYFVSGHKQEKAEPSVSVDVDVEQTQLHDWLLIAIASGSFVGAVLLVVFLGFRSE